VCVGDTIVLNTLRYPDEIRPTDELRIPDDSSKAAQVTEKELQMARALVEGMSEKWKPQQYHDTYREDVMALIKKKIAANQTKTITQPEPDQDKPAKSNVIDLVALLQASLGKKPQGADDGDDDDDPPPRKSRKPAGDDDDDAGDAPPPRARKAPARSGAQASAAKRTTATKAAAKPAAKAAAKPAAKSAVKPAAKRTAVAKTATAVKGTAAKSVTTKSSTTKSAATKAATEKAPARRRKAA
jgi:DNA end-binding protein Ku